MTIFIYKVRKQFEGFSIRRDNWKEIIFDKDFDDITYFIRK
jgi:hypothetical protein